MATKYQEDMLLIKTDKKEANGYDENDFSKSYWIDKIGTVPRYQRGSINIIRYFDGLFENINIDKTKIKMLDISAGSGNSVNEFRQHNYNMEGCEFSKSGREVAKEKFNIDLRAYDFRIPMLYKDNQFDWGMCIASLSMCPEKFIEQAIHEMFRVIKDGILIYIGGLTNKTFNTHHINRNNISYYEKLFTKCGYHLASSIGKGTPNSYGLAIRDEFCSLITKKQAEIYIRKGE